MTDNDDLFELLQKPIEKAAAWAATVWHGLLEAEEIESELWIEVLKSPATAAKIRRADWYLLNDLLTRMAARICMEERDDYEHFTGNFRYSVNEAKYLVEEYFLRDGETMLAEFIDVEIALQRLQAKDEDLVDQGKRPTNFYESLYRRYALGEVTTVNSEKLRQTRACTKLTDNMNRSFKDRVFEFEHGSSESADGPRKQASGGPGTRPRIPSGYDPYEGN